MAMNEEGLISKERQCRLLPNDCIDNTQPKPFAMLQHTVAVMSYGIAEHTFFVGVVVVTINIMNVPEN
jgi:hypothetical protein